MYAIMFLYTSYTIKWLLCIDKWWGSFLWIKNTKQNINLYLIYVCDVGGWEIQYNKIIYNDEDK